MSSPTTEVVNTLSQESHTIVTGDFSQPLGAVFGPSKEGSLHPKPESYRSPQGGRNPRSLQLKLRPKSRKRTFLVQGGQSELITTDLCFGVKDTNSFDNTSYSFLDPVGPDPYKVRWSVGSFIKPPPLPPKLHFHDPIPDLVSVGTLVNTN